MILYFVVLGDTCVCVRSDVSILRLGFHNGVLSVTVRCVKGTWDPNSVLVETDFYGIPRY